MATDPRQPLLPQHPVHTGLAVTAGIRASGPTRVAGDRTHGAGPDRAGTPDDQSLREGLAFPLVPTPSTPPFEIAPRACIREVQLSSAFESHPLVYVHSL